MVSELTSRNNAQYCNLAHKICLAYILKFSYASLSLCYETAAQAPQVTRG
jgi:hypothetical protein